MGLKKWWKNEELKLALTLTMLFVIGVIYKPLISLILIPIAIASFIIFQFFPKIKKKIIKSNIISILLIIAMIIVLILVKLEFGDLI